MKKIIFFKRKSQLDKKSKNRVDNFFVGDFVTISYISVDRDMVHQYKFHGICIANYNKLNMKHVILRHNISSTFFVDFCFNLSSPLIYGISIIKNNDKKKFNKFKKFFLYKRGFIS